MKRFQPGLKALTTKNSSYLRLQTIKENIFLQLIYLYLIPVIAKERVARLQIWKKSHAHQIGDYFKVFMINYKLILKLDLNSALTH